MKFSESPRDHWPVFGVSFPRMRMTTASLLTGILLLNGLWFSSCRTTPPPPEEAAETDLPKATLAPPQELTIPPPPPEEPLPPAVGRREAVRQVHRALPRDLRPLRTPRGLPLALWDFEADGQPECIVVAGPARGLSEPEFQQLADPSRLFAEGAQAVAFHLVLFTSRRGDFEPLQVVALGEHLVFEGLLAAPLGPHPDTPLIVTAAFLTPEGKEIELLVFDDPAAAPTYRRRLSETLTTGFQLGDIDGDGLEDLVVIERAMEEGTGYETFLTWHRWNGRSFREHRTTNVVRNLNGFLARLREQLLDQRPAELLARTLHPGVLAAFRSRGLAPEEIVLRTLGLEPEELPGVPAVREVVYPPILENPFSSTDRVGWFFELSFRIVDSGGSSYIATTRLYMLANPFSDRQFVLAPPGTAPPVR